MHRLHTILHTIPPPLELTDPGDLLQRWDLPVPEPSQNNADHGSPR